MLFPHDDPHTVCAVHTHQHDFLFVYRDESGYSTFIDVICSLYLSSPLVVHQDSHAVIFSNFPAHINMCPCFSSHISGHWEGLWASKLSLKKRCCSKSYGKKLKKNVSLSNNAMSNPLVMKNRYCLCLAKCLKTTHFDGIFVSPD